MKKSKSNVKREVTWKIFPVGASVVIVRPNLWAGACGEVVKVTDGVHRIKIPNKWGDGFWHTDVEKELEFDL